MGNKDLLKIISIALALVSLAACLFIWGQLSGFEKGYFYEVFLSPPSTGFSSSGPNFFQSINQWYFIIAIGFFIYSIGKFLKSLVLSTIICILSLSAGLYPFWDMISYKREVLAMKTKFSYDYWLNNSIYFDWFILFAAIILIFVQVTLFITRKLNTETFKIT